MRRLVLCFLINLCVFSMSYSQKIDSIKFTSESFLSASNFGLAPMYVRSNRHGKVDLRGGQAYQALKLELPILFKDSSWSGSLLVENVIKDKINESFIHQLNANLNWKAFSLNFGRKEFNTNHAFYDLSTGVLGISNNARPFPKLQFGILDFTDVPFTKGFFEVRGFIAQGWLEKDRYMSSAYLHQKEAYLRMGGKLPIKGFLGITHSVLYGGTNPQGKKAGSGWDTYKKVFFSKSGNATQAIRQGEVIGNLGDSKGVIDMGGELHYKFLDGIFFFSKSVEYAVDLPTWWGWENIYPWVAKPDHHMGGFLKINLDNFPIKAVSYEHQYSVLQHSAGLPDAVDSYKPFYEASGEGENFGEAYGGRTDLYNNYIYRDGWTYHDRSLGSPLILTKDVTSYFDEGLNDFGAKFTSNRVDAHNIGCIVSWRENLSFKLFSTFSKNYGTYAGLNNGRYSWASKIDPNYHYQWEKPFKQQYYMIETSYKHKALPAYDWLLTLGLDRGDEYQSFGFLFGITYTADYKLVRETKE